jgi:hypothetical protein
MRFTQLATAALATALIPLAAKAAPITLYTSLVSAQANGNGTAIILNNDTTYNPLYPNGYQQTIDGSGYTVSFTGLAAGYGVRRDAGGQGAIPVAGVQGTSPTYLRGDFGSAQTTSAAQAGSYFTTGATGKGDGITVTFSSTMYYITLLWGSVDGTNLVTLLNGTTVEGTVTGTQVQAATSGFVANGYQGAGGSAYVELYEPDGFNSVFFSSGVNSFEFTGFAGSDNYFQIPEPAELAVFAAGLFSLALMRRRAG